MSALDPFSYDLPEDRIAQRPCYPYDAAKLLVVQRQGDRLTESRFSHFAELLKEGDLVVFNDSKVIPARFFGEIAGRGTAVELLLLTPLEGVNRWECLGRPLKKLPSGTEVIFPQGLRATIGERLGEMSVAVSFSGVDSGSGPLSAEQVATLVTDVGLMPIPPYIRGGHADAQDREDYQPTQAREAGSVAAPTASLHFTPAVHQKIAEAGAESVTVTLHVGAASFLPLWRPGQADSSAPTPPGQERMRYSASAVAATARTRARGGRVIAVGTTVVRALESFARLPSGTADGAAIPTELFITPGHTFQNVDVLVTNFHQPCTTHLLLVQAFMGRPLLERSYRYALDNQFRFLSYGDGMCIL